MAQVNAVKDWEAADENLAITRYRYTLPEGSVEPDYARLAERVTYVGKP